MSQIITVATMKGGSGKSTVASCLAVHWHLGGRRPTIIDADPQRSIARLAARERALGGVPVVEDATEHACELARRHAVSSGLVMLDTLNMLINSANDRRPIFRCLLTQTIRDSVVAKHIRSELVAAGFPLLESEMTNRVIYAEASLRRATPSLIEKTGPAARDIAAIAAEVDNILAIKQAAA